MGITRASDCGTSNKYGSHAFFIPPNCQRSEPGGNNSMTVAKGRSCIMVELDILNETLENMVNSTESKFRDIIDSLKARLFDIEHDITIAPEECNSLSYPYIDELEKYQTQRIISRNKLVICIYSICEATLASICKDYKYKIVKAPNQEIRPKLCPNLDGRECNVKRRKSTNYYLSDYLYTLNHNYIENWSNAYTVSTIIKDLRNYLTHSKADVKQAAKIIEKLSIGGFGHISQTDGKIIIENVEDVKKILKLCYDMLVEAERLALGNLTNNHI